MPRTYPLLLVLAAAWSFFSCTAPRPYTGRAGRAIYREIKTSPVFARSFTGFRLADVATGKTLCDVNGDRYFTPASNAKVFTLYTCLKVLADSLPGMEVGMNEARSSVVLFPTGDPTLLHPKFKAWQPVLPFLKHLPEEAAIQLSFEVVNTQLGPGWAWDDALQSYSAEIGPLPIYGNTRHIYAPQPGFMVVEPAFWESQTRLVSALNAPRPIQPGFSDSRNWFIVFDEQLSDGKEMWVPIREAGTYVLDLLNDTLKRPEPIGYLPKIKNLLKDSYNWKVIYSTPVDTVLRRMMWQSDNFIAEQLLLVCSGEKFDTLRQKAMIQWAKDSLFFELKDPPKWVDGSGLSRYNLATPSSLVAVLQKLWHEQPRERLFDLFPHNGQPETTLDWMKSGANRSWLFAKTGSMSGVQCISGYLVGRSGRVLAFSFMNNNFVEPGKAWKEEMERVLWEVRERY